MSNEKCKTCDAKLICTTTPNNCNLNEAKELTPTAKYFVMAFVMDGADKRKQVIRHEVKKDKKEAIALAFDWHKDFLTYNLHDHIEIYLVEHVEVNSQILNLSKK